MKKLKVIKFSKYDGITTTKDDTITPLLYNVAPKGPSLAPKGGPAISRPDGLRW